MSSERTSRAPGRRGLRSALAAYGDASTTTASRTQAQGAAAAPPTLGSPFKRVDSSGRAKRGLQDAALRSSTPQDTASAPQTAPASGPGRSIYPGMTRLARAAAPGPAKRGRSPTAEKRASAPPARLPASAPTDRASEVEPAREGATAAAQSSNETPLTPRDRPGWIAAAIARLDARTPDAPRSRRDPLAASDLASHALTNDVVAGTPPPPTLPSPVDVLALGRARARSLSPPDPGDEPPRSPGMRASHASSAARGDASPQHARLRSRLAAADVDRVLPSRADAPGTRPAHHRRHGSPSRASQSSSPTHRAAWSPDDLGRSEGAPDAVAGDGAAGHASPDRDGAASSKDRYWRMVHDHAVHLLRSPPPPSILKPPRTSRAALSRRHGARGGGKRSAVSRVDFADEDSIYTFTTEDASSHGSRPWGFGYERDEGSLTASEELEEIIANLDALGSSGGPVPLPAPEGGMAPAHAMPSDAHGRGTDGAPARRPSAAAIAASAAAGIQSFGLDRVHASAHGDSGSGSESDDGTEGDEDPGAPTAPAPSQATPPPSHVWVAEVSPSAAEAEVVRAVFPPNQTATQRGHASKAGRGAQANPAPRAAPPPLRSEGAEGREPRPLRTDGAAVALIEQSGLREKAAGGRAGPGEVAVTASAGGVATLLPSDTPVADVATGSGLLMERFLADLASPVGAVGPMEHEGPEVEVEVGVGDDGGGRGMGGAGEVGVAAGREKRDEGSADGDLFQTPEGGRAGGAGEATGGMGLMRQGDANGQVARWGIPSGTSSREWGSDSPRGLWIAGKGPPPRQSSFKLPVSPSPLQAQPPPAPSPAAPPQDAATAPQEHVTADFRSSEGAAGAVAPNDGAGSPSLWQRRQLHPGARQALRVVLDTTRPAGRSPDKANADASAAGAVTGTDAGVTDRESNAGGRAEVLTAKVDGGAAQTAAEGGTGLVSSAGAGASAGMGAGGVAGVSGSEQPRTQRRSVDASSGARLGDAEMRWLLRYLEDWERHDNGRASSRAPGDAQLGHSISEGLPTPPRFRASPRPISPSPSRDQAIWEELERLRDDNERLTSLVRRLMGMTAGNAGASITESRPLFDGQ